MSRLNSISANRAQPKERSMSMSPEQMEAAKNAKALEEQRQKQEMARKAMMEDIERIKEDIGSQGDSVSKAPKRSKAPAKQDVRPKVEVNSKVSTPQTRQLGIGADS